MLMKVFESIIQAAECELCEGAHPCNVAEIKVGVEAPNDFSRDEALNRRNPHLGWEHRVNSKLG